MNHLIKRFSLIAILAGLFSCNVKKESSELGNDSSEDSDTATQSDDSGVTLNDSSSLKEAAVHLGILVGVAVWPNGLFQEERTR